LAGEQRQRRRNYQHRPHDQHLYGAVDAACTLHGLCARAVTVTAINPANPSESATAVVTLLQQPLTGNTYYVATNGVDDPHHGTFAAPFASLQYAAGVARRGDTVLVRGGVYNKLFTLTNANSGALTAPITYAAYGGETPVIDGANLRIPGADRTDSSRSTASATSSSKASPSKIIRRRA
jgi:hypothetical protein